MRQKGAGKPDIEPAAADRVQHSDLAGQLERMIEDGQHGASYQTGLARALGGRRQKNHRVRAVAAIMMEIMLDDPDMSEAEIIRLFRKSERLSEILCPSFLFRLDVGKELYPELHFRSPRAASRPLLTSAAIE